MDCRLAGMVTSHLKNHVQHSRMDSQDAHQSDLRGRWDRRRTHSGPQGADHSYSDDCFDMRARQYRARCSRYVVPTADARWSHDLRGRLGLTGFTAERWSFHGPFYPTKGPCSQRGIVNGPWLPVCINSSLPCWHSPLEAFSMSFHRLLLCVSEGNHHHPSQGQPPC